MFDQRISTSGLVTPEASNLQTTISFGITYPEGLFSNSYYDRPNCFVTIDTFGSGSTFYASVPYQIKNGTSTESPTWGLLRLGGSVYNVNFGYTVVAIGKWK